MKVMNWTADRCPAVSRPASAAAQSTTLSTSHRRVTGDAVMNAVTARSRSSAGRPTERSGTAAGPVAVRATEAAEAAGATEAAGPEAAGVAGPGPGTAVTPAPRRAGGGCGRWC